MAITCARELVETWARRELDGDADGLLELFAPEFHAVGPVGFVLDSAQWVDRHRSGMISNDAFDVHDLTIRTYGDTVVMIGRLEQKTTAMGRDTSGSFRVTVVAVKNDDAWTMANVQLSGPLIPPGEMPSFAK
nr:nuclear transport factor 2 family protein [Kibdelosporangium sp. MJ126-NF4]CEL14522.1 hypothetical protein [Kibdelosporangium sp. MJ126-NF4]CTQ88887.1 hypothetical protein [Kibdelosporangium sp. MJ126-NF4]